MGYIYIYIYMDYKVRIGVIYRENREEHGNYYSLMGNIYIYIYEIEGLHGPGYVATWLRTLSCFSAASAESGRSEPPLNSFPKY